MTEFEYSDHLEELLSALQTKVMQPLRSGLKNIDANAKETGAAQTDAALLRAEDIDWQQHTISYQRCKTCEWAHLQIGGRLEELLRRLASQGSLFPVVAKSNNSARSS